MQFDDSGCGECGGRLYVDGDETICGDCGLVVGADRLDRGPEWRSFPDKRINPKRTGAPLTLARHDRGLSTEIGRGYGLPSRRRWKFRRLRRQHNRARISTKRDRNQIYAFEEIKRLVGRESLPTQVRDQACRLFRTAQNEDLLRGRSIEGFAAACLYAACRVASLSRTVEEIVEPARASRDEFQAAYTALNRELGLAIGVTSPVEYLPRYATRLGLPTSVERRARELAEQTEERGILNGRNPSGVAAACLYTAAKECGADLTQREAASVASVAPVTLRNTYQQLDVCEESIAVGRDGDDGAADGERSMTDGDDPTPHSRVTDPPQDAESSAVTE